eukprot:2750520-Pleurochrysis_carterae.AAC.1
MMCGIQLLCDELLPSWNACMQFTAVTQHRSARASRPALSSVSGSARTASCQLIYLQERIMQQ